MDKNIKPYAWKRDALVTAFVLIGFSILEVFFNFQQTQEQVIKYLGDFGIISRGNVAISIFIGLFIEWGAWKATLIVMIFCLYISLEYYWCWFSLSVVCISLIYMVIKSGNIELFWQYGGFISLYLIPTALLIYLLIRRRKWTYGKFKL